MSSETRFTPGPWWVEPETGDVVARDGDWEICTFSRSDHQHEHDTNLIAAAPELYEALASMVESYGDVDFLTVEDREADPDVQQARAALAKGRGEQ